MAQPLTDDQIRAELERRATAREQAAMPQPASGISDEMIAVELKRRKALAAPKPGLVEDISRSAVTGLQQGVAAIPGAPRDVRNMALDVGGWIAKKMGVSDDDIAKRRAIAESLPGPLGGANVLDALNHYVGTDFDTSSAGFNDLWRRVTGKEQYEPQTVAGEYTRTVASFLPGALLPGSAGARAARVVLPATASETAGQITKGTPVEPWARMAGGVAGGIATEAGLAASARAQAAKAAARAPLKDAVALEEEFGPMTAGERSGNVGQRIEEQNMRIGQNSEAAASEMRGFDARRVGPIRDNIMKIVTRGQQAISRDAGEAGTILADELRQGRARIRALASRQYEVARELAKGEAIPPSDELGVRIEQASRDNFYEVPPPAAKAITILEDKIKTGTASQADVEAARQALNRERGAAINARDDAKEFVYDDIINALDDWQAGITRNPEAKRAMEEARSLYGEAKQLYTPQGKVDLGDGMVGRTDLGGRAIDKVINTDLTGAQVLDSIFGAGGKPSQQALAAVRRIRQLGAGTITYTNRAASSGVRVPGRRSIGGAGPQGALAPENLDMRLANAKRAVADDPTAPGGMQQPTEVLQSLREGVMHRLMEPLDTYLQRTQDRGLKEGGLIPAQRTLTHLETALDPSRGRPILELIMTPKELAALERARVYFSRIVPPSGAAYSGTKGALRQMLAKGAALIARTLTGPFAPAVEQAILEGQSAAAARKAIKPAKPLGKEKPLVATERIPSTVYAIESAAGAAPMLGYQSPEQASDEDLLRALEGAN